MRNDEGEKRKKDHHKKYSYCMNMNVVEVEYRGMYIL